MSMPLLMDIDATAQKIVEIFEKLDKPFAFTGGLAAITYGDPRTTNGVDIIMKINPWEIDFAKAMAKVLADVLGGDFYFSIEACREAIEKQTMFQAVDLKTMVKIDFHLSDIVPGSCDRRQNTRIPTGQIVPMVIPEDSILSKLVWIKLGSGISRKDVVAVLRVQKDLDTDYLETTAKQLGVEQILNELKIIAGSNDPNIIF
ncbi:MAG: hypothetical protein FWC50_00430 [Planctomycetaceae bacterium]|nr:hypothetical protein [Planctomycetaceae bacterium]